MSSRTEEKWIATLTHGRYLIERGETSEGAPLLVGFHGYGENAERHLEKLRQIPGAERWLLCAIGALHPFYNTKTGEVVDSWMTKRGREQAIDDNVAYVARVISEVRRTHQTSDRLVIAGFSQGVAMAYRAALLTGVRCDGLIVLAGDVPADAVVGQPRVPPVLLGRGTRDQWYTETKMDEDLAVLKQLGATVETCVFEGGHDWTPEFWRQAGELLARTGAPRSIA
ncbi:MAG: phospholipase [Acidobacteriota bacterium]